MKANEIKEGMNFYDERNDRYIKVDSIDKASKTAMCTVEEYDDFYYQLFNLQELTHFSLN